MIYTIAATTFFTEAKEPSKQPLRALSPLKEAVALYKSRDGLHLFHNHFFHSFSLLKLGIASESFSQFHIDFKVSKEIDRKIWENHRQTALSLAKHSIERK